MWAVTARSSARLFDYNHVYGVLQMHSRQIVYMVCALVSLKCYAAADCAEQNPNEASAIAWVKQNQGTFVRDEKHPDRPVVDRKSVV